MLPHLALPDPTRATLPDWPGVCDHIRAIDDFHLNRVEHLCRPVAQGLIDAGGGGYADTAHLLYVLSAESAGDCNANAENWGTIGRVPVGCLSHMSHLWPGRSMRLLGYLIDPMDVYEASLLAAMMIYTPGEGGWSNWWHVHWQLNRRLVSHGIQGVYHCPADAYWRLVRGGRQDCPYD